MSRITSRAQPNKGGKTLLFEETQHNLKRIRALREIVTAITSTLDLRTVLYLLLENVERFLPFSHASAVRLWNRQTGTLKPEASRNIDMKRWQIADSPFDRELRKTKTPLVVANLQRGSRTRKTAFFREHALVSYLGVPLVVSDEFLGVLEYYTKEKHLFTEEEIEFLSALAAQAAIAIQKAYAHEVIGYLCPKLSACQAQLYEQIKRQASELQEKNAELERSNEVKSTFLRFMSHEVRTPLTTLFGYSGMLLDGLLGSLSEEQSKAVRAIQGQSTELFTLIDNVLEATRLETGKVMVETHEVDLAKLIEDLKAGYNTPLHKDITLEWRLPPELPAIRTDVDKIKAIIKNLLNNAIRFTEQGSVSVFVRYLRAEQAIELKVQDSGIGIPGQLKSHIFELFGQANSSDTRVQGGVGLGLYIVKKYTELLRGKVEVESEVGKGSTFTVTLPVAIDNDIFGTVNDQVCPCGDQPRAKSRNWRRRLDRCLER